MLSHASARKGTPASARKGKQEVTRTRRRRIARAVKSRNPAIRKTRAHTSPPLSVTREATRAENRGNPGSVIPNDRVCACMHVLWGLVVQRSLWSMRHGDNARACLCVESVSGGPSAPRRSSVGPEVKAAAASGDAFPHSVLRPHFDIAARASGPAPPHRPV